MWFEATHFGGYLLCCHRNQRVTLKVNRAEGPSLAAGVSHDYHLPRHREAGRDRAVATQAKLLQDTNHLFHLARPRVPLVSQAQSLLSQDTGDTFGDSWEGLKQTVSMTQTWHYRSTVHETIYVLLEISSQETRTTCPNQPTPCYC